MTDTNTLAAIKRELDSFLPPDRKGGVLSLAQERWLFGRVQTLERLLALAQQDEYDAVQSEIGLQEQLRTTETTLAHAEAFIEHQDMSYRWAEWCEGRDPSPRRLHAAGICDCCDAPPHPEDAPYIRPADDPHSLVAKALERNPAKSPDGAGSLVRSQSDEWTRSSTPPPPPREDSNQDRTPDVPGPASEPKEGA